MDMFEDGWTEDHGVLALQILCAILAIGGVITTFIMFLTVW